MKKRRSAAYAALVKVMTRSSKGKQAQDKLVNFIVQSRYGENVFNCSAKTFVLAFRNKLLELDDLLLYEERFPDAFRLRCLQNAVSLIEELDRVKLDSRLLGKQHSYTEY